MRRDLLLRLFDVAALIEEGLARPRLVQLEVLGFIGRQGQRLIAIFEPARVVLDLAREPLEADRECRPAHGLHRGLGEIARVEQPDRLARQLGAALVPALHPQAPALERMDLLDRMVALEVERIGLDLADAVIHRRGAAHDGFDVVQL